MRVVDPIRFFRNFVPSNVRSYSLADDAANSQLFQEFITAFQAAVQSLSRTTDIASIAAHGPELAAALTNESGPEGSWIERFGLEVVAVAISAIEYDEASRELMDKYNKGTLLGGSVGNAYAQAICRFSSGYGREWSRWGRHAGSGDGLGRHGRDGRGPYPANCFRGCNADRSCGRARTT